MSNKIKRKVKKEKKKVKEILKGKKNKLIVIMGPCSIHNERASYKYAKKIKKIRNKYKNLEIIMRVYFEKPRTITGWKGLIYDPDLNDEIDINKGIKKAIKILKKIKKIKIPIATEFISNILIEYIKKYITIGTIGARNCTSQLHREMASYLNIPIGFKNDTYGKTIGSINSILACKKKTFNIYFSKKGKIKIKKKIKNKNCFLILRGGEKKTNFKEKEVLKEIKNLEKVNLKKGIIIDLSHDNSKKIYKRQINNAKKITKQFKKKNKICGVMIESNIKEGNQKIGGKKLNPYISITDGCISFKQTIKILKILNEGMQEKKPII